MGWWWVMNVGGELNAEARRAQRNAEKRSDAEKTGNKESRGGIVTEWAANRVPPPVSL